MFSTVLHYENEEMEFSLNHPINLVNIRYDAMYGGAGIAVDSKKDVIVEDNVKTRYSPSDKEIEKFTLRKNEIVVVRRRDNNWVEVSGIRYRGWITLDKE